MEWEITWSGLLSAEGNLVTANIVDWNLTVVSYNLDLPKLRMVSIFEYLFKSKYLIRETKTIKPIFLDLILNFKYNLRVDFSLCGTQGDEACWRPTTEPIRLDHKTFMASPTHTRTGQAECAGAARAPGRASSAAGTYLAGFQKSWLTLEPCRTLPRNFCQPLYALLIFYGRNGNFHSRFMCPPTAKYSAAELQKW